MSNLIKEGKYFRKRTTDIDKSIFKKFPNEYTNIQKISDEKRA